MSGLRAEAMSVVLRGRKILDRVSVDFGASGLVAIAGPNGAGKSTLVKCLAGVMAPDEGVVRLDARHLNAWPGKQRARRIGYLPQQFEPHWDFTGGEVLALGAARAGVPPPELSDMAALISARWSTLSGGERTRVLFAAIEAGRPDILLADEPAANLDVARQVEALVRLRTHAQTRLAIVVVHDLNLALRAADRLIVLHQGQVALDGAPQAVVQDRTLDSVFGISFVRESVANGLWLRPHGL